jgi:hypothetical protein
VTWNPDDPVTRDVAESVLDTASKMSEAAWSNSLVVAMARTLLNLMSEVESLRARLKMGLVH